MSCVGILETKVNPSLFAKISAGLLPGWRWTSNDSHSHQGRVWIGWKPQAVELTVCSMSSQVTHCHVRLISLSNSCYFSVVYGEHTFVARRTLWDDMIQSSVLFSVDPWLVAGDFNAICHHSDRIGSSNIWILAFDEFGNCLDQAGLDDLRYIGHRFTWSTSSGALCKQRKIDRVLVNDKWSVVFSFSEANFLAPGVSDHTSMIIRLAHHTPSRKPFKFYNFWMAHPSFSDIVTQVWDSQLSGTSMFVLCQKLKLLK